MNSTKILLILLIFISYSHAFSQGTIKLAIVKNETGKLIDNKEMDTVVVYYYYSNSQSQQKQIYHWTKGNDRLHLRPGIYTFEFKVEPDKTIKICDVSIYDNKLSFVSILIEPDIKFTKKEIRQRKIYDNYRKSKCK